MQLQIQIKINNFIVQYLSKKLKIMKISINVNDNLLSDFGVIYIQEFLQKQLELRELQLSANRITKYLQASKNVDWENEFETARQEAWDEHKHKFLNFSKI